MAVCLDPNDIDVSAAEDNQETEENSIDFALGHGNCESDFSDLDKEERENNEMGRSGSGLVQGNEDPSESFSGAVRNLGKNEILAKSLGIDENLNSLCASSVENGSEMLHGAQDEGMIASNSRSIEENCKDFSATDEKQEMGESPCNVKNQKGFEELDIGPVLEVGNDEEKIDIRRLEGSKEKSLSLMSLSSRSSLKDHEEKQDTVETTKLGSVLDVLGDGKKNISMSLESVVDRLEPVIGSVLETQNNGKNTIDFRCREGTIETHEMDIAQKDSACRKLTQITGGIKLNPVANSKDVGQSPERLLGGQNCMSGTKKMLQKDNQLDIVWEGCEGVVESLSDKEEKQARIATHRASATDGGQRSRTNKKKNGSNISGKSTGNYIQKNAGQGRGEIRNFHKREKRFKQRYSRAELLALRLIHVEEQNKRWSDIYKRLRPVVAREIDQIASSNCQRQNPVNRNGGQNLGKKKAGGLLHDCAEAPYTAPVIQWRQNSNYQAYIWPSTVPSLFGQPCLTYDGVLFTSEPLLSPPPLLQGEPSSRYPFQASPV